MKKTKTELILQYIIGIIIAIIGAYLLINAIEHNYEFKL